MKKLRIYAVALLAVLFFPGCETTTSGGVAGASRSQQFLVSSEDVQAGSDIVFQRVLKQARDAAALNRNARQVERVRKISKDLVAQAGVFRPDALAWQWDVSVVDEPLAGIYCLPGGKLIVSGGLLGGWLTDSELAAVVGHAMSHVLREHGRELVSQAFAKKNALSAGATMLGFGTIPREEVISMVEEHILTLPFTATMESEADGMGVELMARAGYDPKSAISAWQKISAQSARWKELNRIHAPDTQRMAALRQSVGKVGALYSATRQQKNRSAPAAKTPTAGTATKSRKTGQARAPSTGSGSATQQKPAQKTGTKPSKKQEAAPDWTGGM